MRQSVSRLIFGHRKKTGTSPGTVEYEGERRGPVSVSAMDYREDSLKEDPETTVERALALVESESVTWVDVNGIHDADLVRQIGDRLKVHSLVQEDIVSPRQRPKAQEDGPNIYVVVRMLDFDEQTRRVTTEQCSMIIGPRYVVTFQEKPGDIFAQLRERIRAANGRIRKRGSGYLAYSLLDAIIDRYFVVLDHISEVLDDIEAELLTDPSGSTQESIHDLRKELIIVRRAVWPVREVIASLSKMESSAIERELHPYLSDASDHIAQMIDTIEVLREATTGLLDLHHLSLSNRANDIMKVLTIIATVFIPLTFLAGVYGMNFRNMPELEWPYSYPIVIAVMVSVAVGLFVFFRRKKWI